MRNENLYTMKQPALGQKILALRKQKGLTQEELVEKCNINVRTIQRIEAGEVTPRSFTIKTILEVLGVSYKEIVKDESLKTEFKPILGITMQNVKRVLKLSWVFGIIYLFLGLPEFINEYYRLTNEQTILNSFWYLVVKIGSIISFFFFVRGFIATGKIYQNNLLSIVSIITLIAVVLFGIYDVISLFYFEDWMLFVLMIKSVLFGILTILLGISVILLNKKLGVLSIITGSFEILAGLAFLILVPELGISLLFPMQLLEIILLYKIAEKK